jgi:hypothetical protein
MAGLPSQQPAQKSDKCLPGCRLTAGGNHRLSIFQKVVHSGLLRIRQVTIRAAEPTQSKKRRALQLHAYIGVDFSTGR